MKAHIYNTETMALVAVISGDTNKQCEDKADELGYMGVDEYGLTYSPAFDTVDGVIECDDAEEFQA